MEMIQNLSWRDRFRHYHEQHKHKLEGIFFAAGFIFDIIAVHEGADHLLMVVQQFIYIFVIGAILYWDIHHETRPDEKHLHPKFEKFWKYRGLALHFCLGTLMNIYSLFFLMSASFFSSIVFVLLLFGALVANELKVVKKRGVDVKFSLYVICFFCFASMMFPMAFGWVGLVPFLCAFLTTLGMIAFLYHRLHKKLGNDGLNRRLLYPGLGTSGIFLLLYLFGLIPPVPLSATKMGVYHRIDKTQAGTEALYRQRPWWNVWDSDSAFFVAFSPPEPVAPEGEVYRRVELSDKYLLHHENPWWRFWRRGDQDFVARPGDKIHFFVAISSPGSMADTVFVRWFFHDPKAGWSGSDRIPMKITGGRKAGFRGFTSKQNFDYGDGQWRASVETSDGREIGRMYFEVTKAEEDPARVFTAETY